MPVAIATQNNTFAYLFYYDS